MKMTNRHLVLAFVLTLLIGGASAIGASAQRKITANPDHYDRTGIASFYSLGFEGKQTSTGERFDSRELTAASNTLPLNTYVKVTNLKNGKWVMVRINDRMAVNNKRLIDLSKSAARAIQMVGAGLAHVTVQTLPQEFYKFFSVAPDELLSSSGMMEKEKEPGA